MKKHLLASLLCASCFTANATIVEMQTDHGTITVNLFDQHTPITVENFLNYVSDGSYDGSVIHRSVNNFVLQGGGFKFDGDFKAIDTADAIANEPVLSNVKGTIAMAKVGGNENSATSQWFINLKDNSSNLDLQNGGFTVFGEITADSFDTIAAITSLVHCGEIPTVGLNEDQCPTVTTDFNAENLVMINSVVVTNDDPNSSDSLSPQENTLIDEDNSYDNDGSSSGGTFAWMLSLLALAGFAHRK